MQLDEELVLRAAPPASSFVRNLCLFGVAAIDIYTITLLRRYATSYTAFLYSYCSMQEASISIIKSMGDCYHIFVSEGPGSYSGF